ncbi:MAG TPA: hypothetical protein EYP16_05130 [Candidatus Atribacteria bacterium]|nr:hypothetical protein [Candidatus Atribacteria bacterium]
MINIGEFVESSLKSILSSFGIEVSKVKKITQEYHTLSKSINVIVGIVGKEQGIISYEVEEDVAKGIFSLMAPGMEFNIEDPMSISAISEVASMVSGTILTMINNPNIDITPPTTILGRDINAIINTESTEKISFSLLGSEIIIGYSIS